MTKLAFAFPCVVIGWCACALVVSASNHSTFWVVVNMVCIAVNSFCALSQAERIV